MEEKNLTTKKVPAKSTPQQIKPAAPPQESAQDTSNWDKKEFTAPNGRIIIETKEKDSPNRVVIVE